MVRTASSFLPWAPRSSVLNDVAPGSPEPQLATYCPGLPASLATERARVGGGVSCSLAELQGRGGGEARGVSQCPQHFLCRECGGGVGRAEGSSQAALMCLQGGDCGSPSTAPRERQRRAANQHPGGSFERLPTTGPACAHLGQARAHRPGEPLLICLANLPAPPPPPVSAAGGAKLGFI